MISVSAALQSGIPAIGQTGQTGPKPPAAQPGNRPVGPATATDGPAGSGRSGTVLDRSDPPPPAFGGRMAIDAESLVTSLYGAAAADNAAATAQARTLYGDTGPIGPARG